MKSKVFRLFFLAVLAAALGAQTIHEPNNDIYKDIDRWAVQGYVRQFLPLIQPYPAPLIDKILSEVITNGDADARAKAAKYKSVTEPGSRGIHVGVLGYIQGGKIQDDSGKTFTLIGAPLAEGLLRINNLLSASYNLSMYGYTGDGKGERYNVPGTYNPYPDFISDVASIGPFEIRQEWTSLMAIGKSNVYFQAGLARTSVGPFYDNGVVVGPQAPRAGHFSFVYYQPRWSFEMLFQTLTATDDFGQEKFADKYNVIHTFLFRPIENLELGFMEAVVWGKRIDPLYLVPFSYLFASQAMAGFDDNSFIGLHVRWRPIDTVLLKTQVYIDDFPFNGIFSGNQKYKLAGELGGSWAPKRSFLSKLDFDYTAVLPYCYTHWAVPDDTRYNGYDGTSYDTPVANYLNYTHLGRNIGPDLEPNSDRISVRSSWKTIPSIDLNLSVYFTRHGNASEGKPELDQNIHDGSIFDDGATDPWITLDPNNHSVKNPYENLQFLNQDVIDTRIGGGFGVTWTIPIPAQFGVLKLSGGYGAEYGWNRSTYGDARPIKDNNGLEHFWSIGGMYSW